MPIVGETVWWPRIKNFDSDMYSESWDFEFPAQALFAKVSLGCYAEFDDMGAACCGLMNIRRRLPNNSDEVITFPPVDQFDGAVQAQFNATMTHVTVGAKAWSAYARLLFEIEFWN